MNRQHECVRETLFFLFFFSRALPLFSGVALDFARCPCFRALPLFSGVALVRALPLFSDVALVFGRCPGFRVLPWLSGVALIFELRRLLQRNMDARKHTVVNVVRN